MFDYVMQDGSKSFVEIPNLLLENYGHDHSVFEGINKGRVLKVSASSYKKQVESLSKIIYSLINRKERIVISILFNCVDWNYLDLAIVSAEAIHVPLQIGKPYAENLNLIQQLSPDLVVVGSISIKNRLNSDLGGLIVVHDLISIWGLSPKRVAHEGVGMTNNLKETAVILFTSGSSSGSAAVTLSRQNLWASIRGFVQSNLFNSSSRYLSLLPAAFSAERKLSYSCQLAGGTIIYPSRSMTLEQSLEVFQPNITAMVPIMLKQLIGSIRLKRSNLSLKRIICGGAAVKAEVRKQVEDLGVEIFDVYGMTESGSLLSYNCPGNRRSGSVGKVSPDIETRLSSESELSIRGDCVSNGYLDVKAKTILRVKDSEGWFYTGDIVEFDEDGFLYIKGRKKSSFKNSRGQIVFPEIIEQQLNILPEIDEAIVLGEYEDNLKCIIVPKEAVNPQKILTALRDFNNSLSDELKILSFVLVKKGEIKQLLTETGKISRAKAVNYLKSNTEFIVS